MKKERKLKIKNRAKHPFILQGGACTLEWASCGNTGVYRW